MKYLVLVQKKKKLKQPKKKKRPQTKLKKNKKIKTGANGIIGQRKP